MNAVLEDVRSIPPGLLEQVAAGAAGIAAVDDLGADVEQHRARGRSTVSEYRFRNGLCLFAKRYAERREAVAAYELLEGLQAQGFGSGSPHRVAEPLACFPDWGVLLTRAAPGVSLGTLAAHPGPWEDGLRAAGRWLARLHGVSVKLGPRRDITPDVSGVARLAATAAARHPTLEGLLLRLVEELAERRAATAGFRSPVLTHGRYHAGHVLVAPDSVTVIDLDQAALADPAKDVGEFLRRLRAQAKPDRLGHDAAEKAMLVFVGEYAAGAGAVPRGLVYYWSDSVLSKLLRVLEVDHETWEKRLEFYRAEFEDIPRRVRTFGELVPTRERS